MSKNIIPKGQYVQLTYKNEDTYSVDLISGIFIAKEDINIESLVSEFLKDIDINQLDKNLDLSNIILTNFSDCYAPGYLYQVPYQFVSWLESQEDLFNFVKPAIINIKDESMSKITNFNIESEELDINASLPAKRTKNNDFTI